MFSAESENDSEAEALLPANAVDQQLSQAAPIQLENHNNFQLEARAEADSSTATSNDYYTSSDVVIIEDNEAEADPPLDENRIPPTLQFEDPEEASGSNIVDSDLPIIIPEVANPYAYLERDEFTSERFKIEVTGLPKHYGFSQLKKLFNEKLDLKAHKIKPLPATSRGSSAFVNFKTEEDRATALKVINGQVWKKCTLSAVPAKPVADPLVRKRTYQQSMGGFGESEDIKLSATELVKKATAPWSDIPYKDQLERKMGIIKDVVNLIYKGIANVNKEVKANAQCPIEQIRPSPSPKGYRNKCEFTIGYNPDTSEKTVGFRAASYKRGSTAVGPVDELPHIPKLMIDVVNSFQNFIRTSDPNFDPYDPETHSGLWKQLTVRVTQKGEVLVVLLVNGRQLDNELLDNIKVAIKEYYTSDSLVSTFLIKVTESSGDAERNKPEVVFGNGKVVEDLFNLKFRISAEAFFQVNSPAAEVLYSNIKEAAEIDSNSTILDICCGTGTIGICMAKECANVIGIEMCHEAVADARENAELNEVGSKCRFYGSKAENVLEAICSNEKFDKLVAVVDPPRAGLHNKVIFTLRRNEKFNKLIYVSCDPKAALRNFIDLSRPVSKNYRGQPFLPTKFIPVDMFPDTPHFEMIIVFERKMGNESSTKNE